MVGGHVRGGDRPRVTASALAPCPRVTAPTPRVHASQYPLEHPVCANTPTSGAAYWKLAREGLIMPLACSSAMSPESIEDRVCAWKARARRFISARSTSAVQRVIYAIFT